MCDHGSENAREVASSSTPRTMIACMRRCARYLCHCGGLGLSRPQAETDARQLRHVPSSTSTTPSSVIEMKQNVSVAVVNPTAPTHPPPRHEDTLAVPVAVRDTASTSHTTESHTTEEINAVAEHAALAGHENRKRRAVDCDEENLHVPPAESPLELSEATMTSLTAMSSLSLSSSDSDDSDCAPTARAETSTRSNASSSSSSNSSSSSDEEWVRFDEGASNTS